MNDPEKVQQEFLALSMRLQQEIVTVLERPEWAPLRPVWHHALCNLVGVLAAEQAVSRPERRMAALRQLEAMRATIESLRDELARQVALAEAAPGETRAH
jgi:hypothetical protein